MNAAHIRFEGEAYHMACWEAMMRNLGFRVSGNLWQKAIYAAAGSHLVVQSLHFVRRDELQGYEWQLTLKQTRRWEGLIKFYSVLLAAFAMPQPATVTIGADVFASGAAMKAHANAAILREFALEDLIANQVHRKGDGIQFV